MQQGISEKDLINNFGHDIKKLVDEAVKRGLSLPYGSQEMIADIGGQPPTAIAVPAHLNAYSPHVSNRVQPVGPDDCWSGRKRRGDVLWVVQPKAEKSYSCRA
jgi:hypothetical protein